MFKYNIKDLILSNTSKYSIIKMSKKDYKNLILKLDEFTTKYKINEIKNRNHSHAIQNSILQKKASSILDKAGDLKVYQIAINKKSRVLGVFSKEVFYVIGYDKNHRIYK